MESLYKKKQSASGLEYLTTLNEILVGNGQVDLDDYHKIKDTLDNNAFAIYPIHTGKEIALVVKDWSSEDVVLGLTEKHMNGAFYFPWLMDYALKPSNIALANNMGEYKMPKNFYLLF